MIWTSEISTIVNNAAELKSIQWIPTHQAEKLKVLICKKVGRYFLSLTLFNLDWMRFMIKKKVNWEDGSGFCSQLPPDHME